MLNVSKEKVMRHIFKNNLPILVPIENRMAYMTKLHNEVSGIPGIKVEKGYHYTNIINKTSYSIRFYVLYLNEQGINCDFKIMFSEKMELIISGDTKNDFFFNNTDEIKKLRDGIVKEYPIFLEREKKYDDNQAEREKNYEQNEAKRTKIINLKKSAILAKIKEVAEEEALEYCCQEFSTKIKLNIRLAENEYMEINIPFNKFQEVLPNVREAYQAIKGLMGKGVPLKVRFSPKTNRMKWKKT